jgi:thymidylate kinase
MKMKIITISGLDGSGKTTQVHMLKEKLEQAGKKVYYFHAVRFGIANRFIGTGKNNESGDQSENNDNLKSITNASWLTILLRKVALKIDITRFKKLLKKLEAEGYDYLVSDRYYYDIIVNILYLSSLNLEMLREERKRFEAVPEPDVVIYLEVNPEVIMARENTPDQGMAYLRKKTSLYDYFANLLEMKIINGNRTREEVFLDVEKLIS